MAGALVGMVRLLDRDAACHVYRVGSLEGGELEGELGSLHAADQPGAVPLWASKSGVVSTPDHHPEAPSPGIGTVLRWAIVPARWRGAGPLRARLRAIPSRAARAFQIRRKGVSVEPALSGPPAGFLDRQPGPGSLPLYAAVHPVTGDQLISVDHWEPLALGYGDPTLLGYLLPVAPLTGRLGVRGAELPWAWRFGLRWEGRRPAGYGPLVWIDEVLPQSLPCRISGWALAVPTTARVEILVDGRVVGRARLGIPRPDLAAMAPDADAPACGFEYVLGSGEAPAGARSIEVAARVVDPVGGSATSPREKLRVAGPAPAPTPRRNRPIPEAQRPDNPSLLALTHDLGYGGAQLYLAELLARLVRDHGASTTVVTAADGPLRPALIAAGASVHLNGPIPFDDEQRYETRLSDLVSWGRDQRFGAVFANTIEAFPGVELAHRLGLPCLVAIHESYEVDSYWLEAFPRVDPRVRLRARRAIGDADAVVFEAEATRRLFLDLGEADRLLTIPYAIELDWIDGSRAGSDQAEARRSLGLDPAATVLTCVGAFDPRKAQIPLVRAFAAVAGRHPDAVLVMVGEGPDHRAARYGSALREVAARSGVSDRVRTVPMVPDPRTWQAAGDVLVCPSDVESLPRVVLEAMALEKPVLATDVFGLREVVEDGVTGWLCAARDLDALGEGLERALSTSPAQRRRMGRAASDLVRRRHDPSAYAARIDELLRDLRRHEPPSPTRRAMTQAPALRRRSAFPHERARPADLCWPEGRPRILIADAWLANAGDAAISLATDRRVRRLAPGAAVLHAAYQSDLLGAELPQLDLVPPLAGLAGVAPSIPEMARWDSGSADRLLEDADVVLSQGGGFMMEHYGPFERLRAWELVVERGIPFALCAQSIGSFQDEEARELLARILRAARAVGVREAISLAHVLDLGVSRDRVTLGSDEVFSLFDDPPAASGGRGGVAVVLSAHPVTRADGRPAAPHEPGRLGELIGSLLELREAQPLTLLSSQQGLGHMGRGLEDDSDVIDAALARLPENAAGRVRRVEGYLSPGRLADELAGHRALLSMRMHPALIAMCCGTPAVVMSEAFKAQAMFRGLGLADLIADSADAVEAAAVALTEREPGPPQWERLSEGRRKARSNNAVVKQLLGVGREAPAEPSLPV